VGLVPFGSWRGCPVSGQGSLAPKTIEIGHFVGCG